MPANNSDTTTTLKWVSAPCGTLCMCDSLTSRNTFGSKRLCSFARIQFSTHLDAADIMNILLIFSLYGNRYSDRWTFTNSADNPLVTYKMSYYLEGVHLYHDINKPVIFDQLYRHLIPLQSCPHKTKMCPRSILIYDLWLSTVESAARGFNI